MLQSMPVRDRRRKHPTIVAVALRNGNLVMSLPAPAGHGDIMSAVKEGGWPRELSAKAEAGFLTSEGEFVNRYRASRLAYRAGQTEHLYRELNSEHLWRKGGSETYKGMKVEGLDGATPERLGQFVRVIREMHPEQECASCDCGCHRCAALAEALADLDEE